MKRITLILLSVLFFGTVNAQNIDFPDQGFKNDLVNHYYPTIDTNGDKEISIEEANSFTGTITISKVEESLSGIEHFTKAYGLIIYQYNGNEALDFSNLNFKKIELITPNSIDITLPNVEKIDLFKFEGPAIENINWSTIKEIELLDICTNNENITFSDLNKVSFLEVDYCPNLKNIDFGSISEISNITIQKNKVLQSIDYRSLKQILNFKFIDNEDFKSLNFGNIDNIEKLIIEDNDNLSTIELENMSVESLVVENNKSLEVFDAKVKKLGEVLFKHNSNLKTTFLQNITEEIELYNNKNLQSVTIDAPEIKVVNVNKNITLTQIDFVNTQKIFDLTLRNLESLNAVNFTDFKEINNLTISNTNITEIDLKNIQLLNNFICEYNSALSRISLGQITEIEDLDIDRNFALKDIYLNNLTKANKIDIYENKVSDLDFSKLESINDLLISSINITELDLGKNLKTLQTLRVGALESLKTLTFNNITTLDDLSLALDENLEKLDFGDLEYIKNLEISDYPTSTINLGNLKEVEKFNWRRRDISQAVDFSKLSIKRLELNNAKSLDLSANDSLTYFDCDYCGLSSLSLNTDKNAVEVSLIKNPDLYCVQITNGDNVPVVSRTGGKEEYTQFSTYCAKEEACQEIDTSNQKLKNALLNQNGIYQIDINKDGEICIEEANNYDLPLILERLDLTDISFLKHFVRTPSISLKGNNISDISVLEGLDKLVSLDVSDNQISDISIINNLESLETFIGKYNDIKQFTISKELQLLDLTNNLNLHCIQKPNNININTFRKDRYTIVSENCSYEFSDCQEYNLSYINWDEFISKCEMDGGETNIDLNNDGKVCLEEVNLYQGKINLSSLNITDISFIKDFKSITSLDISNNNISDISALKELKDLHNLNISNNQVSNLSAISNLSQLYNVDVSGNKISEISPLYNSKEIISLKCSNNSIGDIDLSNWSGLTDLSCSDNKLTSIDVSKTPYLNSIDFNNNQVASIIGVERLMDVINLEGANNQLTTVDHTLLNATNIDLSNNKLTSFNLRNLYSDYIDLTNNQLTDLDITEYGYIKVLNILNNRISGCISLPEKIGSEVLNWKKDENVSFIPDCQNSTTYVADFTINFSHKNDAIELTWATVSEKDNNKFEILRSNDGNNYSKIGEITSKGNSTNGYKYSYTDKDLSETDNGILYYRIKQIGKKETKTYDQTIDATLDNNVEFKAARTFFSKDYNMQDIILKWKPMHQKMESFIIYKSKNGDEYTKIAEIEADPYKTSAYVYYDEDFTGSDVGSLIRYKLEAKHIYGSTTFTSEDKFHYTTKTIFGRIEFDNSGIWPGDAEESKLEWTTKPEVNSSHFEVYASEDNNNFTFIGKTLAKGAVIGNYEYTFIPEGTFYPKYEGKTMYFKVKHYTLDGIVTESAVLKRTFTSKYLDCEPYQFKDENLKKGLLPRFDLNNDGELCLAEMSEAINEGFNEWIDLSNMNISNIEGIELLTDITYIDLSNNNISGVLDLSSYRGSLDLSHNEIEKIIIDDAYLSRLNCSHNQITEISGKAERLWRLDISHNKFSGVFNVQPLQKNDYLVFLWCNNNEITELNTDNVFIDDINCSYNKISSLDFSKTPDMSRTFDNLDCSHNNISSITFKDKTPYSLNISYNKFVTFDLSVFRNNIYDFDCSHNQIKSLEGEFPSMQTFDCSYNQLSDFPTTKDAEDYDNFREFEKLNCSHNNIYELPKFQHLTYLDYSYNEQLSNIALGNVYKLKTLKLAGTNSTYVTDEVLSKVEYLDCSDNQFKKMCITESNVLDTLILDDNNLMYLDLSKAMPSLLTVRNNDLEKLNLNNGFNKSMNSVDVTDNEMLSCIQVDTGFDADNAGWKKDAQASWSDDCGFEKNDLLTYDIEYSYDAVELLWTTTSGMDVQEFIVERATNDGDFVEIGRVDKNNYRSAILEYYLSDYDLSTGNVYHYRVIQVKNDGSQSIYQTLVADLKQPATYFSDLSLEIEDNDVFLNWATQSEVRNSHFNVQRSVDGIAYETIATIDGQSEDTYDTSMYSFTDKNIGNENSRLYYRIQQVSLDESISLSNIATVLFDSATTPTVEIEQVEYKVYPNPVSSGSQIIIEGKDIQKVAVYNILGEMMLQKTSSSRDYETINTRNLTKGMYFLVVDNNKAQRVIIQ